MTKRIVLTLVALAALVFLPLPKAVPAAATVSSRPNVIIVLSDDQRWDKITPRYMPNVSAWSQQADGVAFTNSFVTNPLCCPSRTTILTGNYSHTTGVWTNKGTYGGFGAFDDKHTLAVDFQNQGYRTAMIGKYLNGYDAGRMKYVPPGWDRWFADNTGSYYNYGITTNKGTRHFGSNRKDYSTRVLADQATSFVTNSSGQPFFMYFALNAPHGAAIPDARDVGRFAGDPDYRYTERLHGFKSSSLDAAYGVDRAFGQLMSVIPDNTIVLYMSDNGYMWHENHPGHGELSGKIWPYNSSLRVPIIIGGLDNAVVPMQATAGDIVANVDLRTSLLHAAGLTPLTSQEGINWFSPNYAAHPYLEIEHYGPGDETTYCGIRTADAMYARFHNPDGSYSDESFAYTNGGSLADEQTQVAVDPVMRDEAKAACDPAPPGYTWP